MRFSELQLQEPLLKAVSDLGFEECTPIQQMTLPKSLEGEDVLGQGQTGTGKTAAFLLSAMSRLLQKQSGGKAANFSKPQNQPPKKLHQKHPQSRKFKQPLCLIIAPTRELVIQIVSDAKGLGKYSEFEVHQIIGGVSMVEQIKRLENRRCDFLVGTPGRVMDLRRQRHIDLSQVEILVLDEADRMLDMGFISDIRHILRYCPSKEKRQTMMFSATLERSIMRLAHSFTKENRHVVSVEPDQVASADIDQRIYLSRAEDRIAFLIHTLKTNAVKSAIIFVNRRTAVHEVHNALTKARLNSGMLSGEQSQSVRTRTLSDFKKGLKNVIVATDVAGRGLHIEGLSHVINYDLPEDPTQYVHRIGRTGRAGQVGTAISFATEKQSWAIRDIEKKLGASINCQPLPSF